MVQLSLPKNSTINKGKTFKAPKGTRKVKRFRIYRWNPDDGKNPRDCADASRFSMPLRISN